MFSYEFTCKNGYSNVVNATSTFSAWQYANLIAGTKNTKIVYFNLKPGQ